jgi:hypothetical protein
MDAAALRAGIFALHTRRFGTAAEVPARRLIKCGKGKSLFHDLYDDARKHRIEVKFSRVQKQAETRIAEETVLLNAEPVIIYAEKPGQLCPDIGGQRRQNRTEQNRTEQN